MQTFIHVYYISNYYNCIVDISLSDPENDKNDDFSLIQSPQKKKSSAAKTYGKTKNSPIDMAEMKMQTG